MCGVLPCTLDGDWSLKNWAEHIVVEWQEKHKKGDVIYSIFFHLMDVGIGHQAFEENGLQKYHHKSLLKKVSKIVTIKQK